MKKIFIFLSIITCFDSFAQQEATLNIIGQATKSILPDRAVFELKISATRKNESESFLAMSAIYDAVIKKLEAQGFNENQIKLSNYSTYIEYDYSDKKSKKTGYTSDQELILKIPLNKERIMSVYSTLLNDIIEGLNIDLSTECSDSLKNSTEKELIVMALNDARQKAELIASASNCKIQSIDDISYKIYFSEITPIRKSIRFTPPVIRQDEQNQVHATRSYFTMNEHDFYEEIKVTYLIKYLY